MTQHQAVLERLRDVNSTRELTKNSHFQENRALLEASLRQPEIFSPVVPPTVTTRNGLRVVAWNIERGIQFEKILSALQTHVELKDADVYLLTEVDKGMARSKNRHVGRELGEALGLYTVFGPAYFNLDKGNSAEANRTDGENTSAIQGHAILSRYPLKEIELIEMPNTKDHMKGNERQIGCERAVVAAVQSPWGLIDVASAHLALRSSRPQRAMQLEKVILALKTRGRPSIVGGDWNTTTYSANRSWRTILGFWRRVLIGVAKMQNIHHPYPNRYFEKALFGMLQKSEFEIESFNVPGGCTVHYDMNERENFENLGDWIPQWCFRFIAWSLRDWNGKISLKLDWFAARHLMGSRTKVIQDLPRNQNRISDHDPIMVDVLPEGIQ